MTAPVWTDRAVRVTADDTAEVRDAILDGGDPLVPAGSGSRLARGRPPRGKVRLLDLSAMAGIVEYEPEDMTVTARAGTSWASLQETLHEKRQWLPVDLFHTGTVGGVLAADGRCPLAGGFGSIRDYCIGIRFVDGRGREARAGGKVVKNVAGYDLAKLLIGSLGELAVITEATFKVLPKPAGWIGVRLAGPTEDDLRRAQTDLARRWFPAGLWRTNRGEGEELIAAFAGPSVRTRAQAEGFRAAWGDRAEMLGENDVAGFLEDPAEGNDDVLRGWGGALPAFLAVEPLGAIFPRTPWTVDLLRGHLWCRLDPDESEIAVVRKALIPGEGHLHVEGPARSQSVWGRDPGPEADLWRGLKEALDPKGRLPRGRLPGGV